MDLAMHKGCATDYHMHRTSTLSQIKAAVFQFQAVFINRNSDCVCAIVRNKQCNECRRFVPYVSTKFYFNWAMFLTQITMSRHQSEREWVSFVCKRTGVPCKTAVKCPYGFDFLMSRLMHIICWSVDNWCIGQAVIPFNGLAPLDTRITFFAYFFFFLFFVMSNCYQMDISN